MATKTELRHVVRQGKEVLQYREYGGFHYKPWQDVPLEIETAEDILHRETLEQEILDGKREKPVVKWKPPVIEDDQQ